MSHESKTDFAPFRAKIAELAQQHPRTLSHYAYGTAGFRGLANTLDSINLRMGMLACLRSVSGINERLNNSSGSIIGVMVTASHNAAPDNGLKLIRPNGEMLEDEWEKLATDVANAKESGEGEDSLVSVLERVAQHVKVDFSLKPKIFIGRDTRTSSPHLAQLVAKGAAIFNAEVVDFGITTTPQLHYLVREANGYGERPQGSDSKLSADDYLTSLEQAFRALVGSVSLSPTVIDCANGVGSVALSKLAEKLKDILPLELRNCAEESNADKLNQDCGAEHVQKSKSLPLNFDKENDKNKKLASVDGDADRLVYFFINNKGEFRLLDGDRLIALYAAYIGQLLQEANLDLSIGVVQTAYANGASTRYLAECKLPVACTPTGVKHLHHKAHDYDISVYFEANGHGTVLFSHKALQLLKEKEKAAGDQSNNAVSSLLAVSRLASQCTGDAIGDLLLAEAILHKRKWSLSDWDALYEDLPSTMIKVVVKDRNLVQTTDAERVCFAPAGLQEQIDLLIQNGVVENAPAEPNLRRSFARPSGTEDVVRVYAEGATQQEADLLAERVGKLVKHFTDACHV